MFMTTTTFSFANSLISASTGSNETLTAERIDDGPENLEDELDQQENIDNENANEPNEEDGRGNADGDESKGAGEGAEAPPTGNDNQGGDGYDPDEDPVNPDAPEKGKNSGGVESGKDDEDGDEAGNGGGSGTEGKMSMDVDGGWGDLGGSWGGTVPVIGNLGLPEDSEDVFVFADETPEDPYANSEVPAEGHGAVEGTGVVGLDHVLTDLDTTGTPTDEEMGWF